MSVAASNVAVSTDPAVRRAVRSTYLVFAVSGFAFANWASRIPQVQEHLGLSNRGLGYLLLAIAAGSVVSLPTAGPLISRIGSRRTVLGTAMLLAVGFAVAAVGYAASAVAGVALGLVLFGFANGAWDVGMNVQGALAERRWGKAIMPRFHAGWSAGTVTGALLGALLVFLGVPVPVHLATVAVLVAVVVPFAVRGYLPDAPDDHTDEPAPTGRRALFAWKEPRTLLVGLFVLAFAFAEGAGNDWVSVALIRDYDTAATVGTLGFATFLAAMMTGRWFGPLLLDRFGRVPVVRATALVAVVGVLLFVSGGVTALAFVGLLLWGLGVSLGFPVGMSAGADDPRHAAARVSVIASIGYCAFLGGPPLLGHLADDFTVLKSLVVVAVLLGVSAMIAASVRPTTTAAPRD